MIIISSLLLAVSGLWIILGITQYGFWQNNVPGVGFFPVIAGAIVFLFSIISLVTAIRKSPESNKKEENTKEEKAIVDFIPQNWIVPFAMGYALVVILVFVYVGAITSVFLSCFAWTFLICKRSLSRSLLFSFSLALAVYLVFSLWLKTPFPRGLLI